ncbi:transketolase C-terminal domain-containing protein, partial [Sphingomonas pseudosanguinis]|uniref:transketolase C-terminal domain-containing protein n=1 Tax=Sphingomonas pseudosanguinis TaxID=413712 RepID=UPI0023E3CBF4
GLSTSVADLRFAKPLDAALIRRMLTTQEVAVTIEEKAIVSLVEHVLTMETDEGLIDAALNLRTMLLPHRPHRRLARRPARGPRARSG